METTSQENTKKLLFTISSPGKIILCGQHAVVYGFDALAMAVTLRCKALVYEHQHGKLCLHLKNSDAYYVFQSKYLQLYNSNDSYPVFIQKYKETYSDHNLHQNVLKFLFKMGIFMKKGIKQYTKEEAENALNNKGYQIIIQSEIPLGKCLGSSAAYNVILATTLFKIFSFNHWIQQSTQPGLNFTQIQLQAIYNLSLAFESVQHGTPSGIDNYVATYGGMIRMRKTQGNTRKFMKLQQKYNKKFLENFDIILVDSGQQKNTKVAVDRVRSKAIGQSQFNKQNWKKIEQIGTFSNLILQNLSKIDQQKQQQQSLYAKSTILQILQKNHKLLASFDISCESIQKIVDRYTIKGKSIGKITGAGMGGYVLVVKQKSFSEKIQSNQKQLKAQIDTAGVLINYY